MCGLPSSYLAPSAASLVNVAAPAATSSVWTATNPFQHYFRSQGSSERHPSNVTKQFVFSCLDQTHRSARRPTVVAKSSSRATAPKSESLQWSLTEQVQLPVGHGGCATTVSQPGTLQYAADGMPIGFALQASASEGKWGDGMTVSTCAATTGLPTCLGSPAIEQCTSPTRGQAAEYHRDVESSSSGHASSNDGVGYSDSRGSSHRPEESGYGKGADGALPSVAGCDNGVMVSTSQIRRQPSADGMHAWRLAWWDAYEKEVDRATEARGSRAAPVIDSKPEGLRPEHTLCSQSSTSLRVRMGHNMKNPNNFWELPAQSVTKHRRLEGHEHARREHRVNTYRCTGPHASLTIPSTLQNRDVSQPPTVTVASSPVSRIPDVPQAAQPDQRSRPSPNDPSVLESDDCPALPSSTTKQRNIPGSSQMQVNATREGDRALSLQASTDDVVPDPNQSTARITDASSRLRTEAASSGENLGGEHSSRSDTLPSIVDPDQEQGRLSVGRLEALYYIREVVLQRLSASADVRLLADVLDWHVPLMDLKAVWEAFRMIRTASASTVAFPRNAQLMPRPRFLSSFHYVARRLRCLLEVYGTEVMDWPYLLCVAAGMSAGRVRDRELMQILHDQGLAMLRQSEQARAQWTASLQQQAATPLEAAADFSTTSPAMAVMEDTNVASLPGCDADGLMDANADAADVNPPSAKHACREAPAADVEEGPAGVTACRASTSSSVSPSEGRRSCVRSRGTPASKTFHVPAIGLRDLVCGFLLPLHHLGQPIDPEYLQLLEGIVQRVLEPHPAGSSMAAAAVQPNRAGIAMATSNLNGRHRGASSTSAAIGGRPVPGESMGGAADDGDVPGGSSVDSYEQPYKQPPPGAWQPPPKLWLIRDLLELYSQMGAPLPPALLHGVRKGCTAAAAELHAAAESTAIMWAATRAVAGDAPADVSSSTDTGGMLAGRRAVPSGPDTYGGSMLQDREALRSRGLRADVSQQGLRRPRTWVRPHSGPRASVAHEQHPRGNAGRRSRRECEVLAGTLASCLYLLSRVVRMCGGGVFFGDGGDGLRDAEADCGSAVASGAAVGRSGLELSPSELAWAHDALESLVPWMHTLTPLQLSGLLRTAVWLGAGEKLLLMPQPAAVAGQAWAPAQCKIAAGKPRQEARLAPPVPSRPTGFLSAYFMALARAVSEQPTAGTVSIGNVVEAVVGVAAAGVAAYGVPPEARDVYGKLLFRANAIMSYQATQRNGFLPPYTLNLVVALAAVVRDGGSAAAVPAKLLAENLRLGERLLPRWHADGLAQIAAALETMSWVVPPGGWVDRFYAALVQRLHATSEPWGSADSSGSPAVSRPDVLMVAAPCVHPLVVRGRGGEGEGDGRGAYPQESPTVMEGDVNADAHQQARSTASAVSDAPVATCTTSVSESTSVLAAASNSSDDSYAAENLHRAPGAPRAELQLMASPAALFPAPQQPDPLSPASVVTLLRAAQHLARVASARTDRATIATATAPTDSTAVGAAATAPDSSLPQPPCGVMPEPLTEVLAVRLGHALVDGKGLHGEDLESLMCLCLGTQLPPPRPHSTAASALPSRRPPGTFFDTDEVANGSSLPLLLLDALAAAADQTTLRSPQSTQSQPCPHAGHETRSDSDARNAATAVFEAPSSTRTCISREGLQTSVATLAMSRTRHVILTALEQALALQLQRQHPTVVARDVDALGYTLERALGRSPGDVWRDAVGLYLKTRCDKVMAASQHGANAVGPTLSNFASAYEVVQTANQLLKFRMQSVVTETDTPRAVVLTGCQCMLYASDLTPNWWCKVSRSADICVRRFCRSSSTGTAARWKGQCNADVADVSTVVKMLCSSSDPVASDTSMAASTGCDHGRSQDAAEPLLSQVVDELTLYCQHLGRWLEASYAAASAPTSLEGEVEAKASPSLGQPRRSGGMLLPHIDFLVKYFSLLLPLLGHCESGLSSGSSSGGYDSTAQDVGAVEPSPLQRQVARTTATETVASGGSTSTCPSPSATDALSASQLVQLAELLAKSRFQPLRFPLLATWPEMYMARVQSQLALMSGVDVCMVVRALVCQSWRPPPETMDALLDRVAADGGLGHIRAVYGPASLVQILSWLAFVRYLPPSDWMEALLGELEPCLGAGVATNDRMSHLQSNSSSSAMTCGASSRDKGGNLSSFGHVVTSHGEMASCREASTSLSTSIGYSNNASRSAGGICCSHSDLSRSIGNNCSMHDSTDSYPKFIAVENSSGSINVNSSDGTEYGRERGSRCSRMMTSKDDSQTAAPCVRRLASNISVSGEDSLPCKVSPFTSNGSSSIANSSRGKNAATASTNRSSTSDTTLGLGELCVLANALAGLRYSPPLPWLCRALEAAGAAAVASSAAAAGISLAGPEAGKGDESEVRGDRFVALRTGIQRPISFAVPRLGLGMQSRASQLAALLWRWAAVASAAYSGHHGSGSGANGDVLETLAGEMASSTVPLLSLMAPQDLVRCAEGMSALQQLIGRLRACSDVSSGLDRREQSLNIGNPWMPATAVAPAPAPLEEVLSKDSRDSTLNIQGKRPAMVRITSTEAKTLREDMLARSISLIGTYHETMAARPPVSTLGSEVCGAVVGSGGGDAGRVHLRLWWDTLERASANTLLTRPPCCSESVLHATDRPQRQQRQGQQQPAGQVKPYNLSVALRCMIAAGHVPSSSWLQRYCQYTLPLLPSYKAQDLAVSLWAFAHMRLSLGAPALPAAAVLGSPAPARTSLRSATMGSHSLSTPTTGRKPSSQAPLNSHTSGEVHTLGERHSGYRWSVPPLAQLPDLQLLRVCAPPALGSWVEAAVGLLPPLLRHCSSADLQYVMWALVVMDFPPPAGWLSQYELMTRPRIPHLSGPALLYSLWAYSKFGHTPSTSYMKAVLQALRPGLLGWTACDGGDSSGVVERLDAQSLALLLHSLSQLDFLPADWWLEEYLKAVLSSLPHMTATGLAIFLRAVATLQICPPEPWLDAVVASATQRLPQFSHQQLESFLSALADLAPASLPSGSLLQRFLWESLAKAPDNRKIAAYYRLLVPYMPKAPLRLRNCRQCLGGGSGAIGVHAAANTAATKSALECSASQVI